MKASRKIRKNKKKIIKAKEENEPSTYCEHTDI